MEIRARRPSAVVLGGLDVGLFGGLWGGAPVYIQQVPREAQRYAGVRLSFDF